VGAPFAITIDHQTLQDDTVTLRMRDSMEQNRIKISELAQILSKETAFP
jgi:glycyl-tRNA synthetase